MHRICASLLVLSLSSLTAAQAAEIDVRPVEGGSTLIVIEGDFEHSDVDTFRTKVAALPTPRVTVAFKSDGGSLVAGIRIGTLIREKKFATVIPDGASCASACALAWLGGSRRFMGEGATIGFHAAYVLKSYGPVESSSGNAILGAYLNQLGLSEDAILYLTKTAPTSIQWMTLADANEHGIATAALSPQQSTTGSSVAGTGADYRDGTAERRATDFVRSLIAHWSKPAPEAMPALEGLYAEKVVYRGTSTSRQAVLRSKHRLAERWAERVYTIRPGSISATCAKAGATCRVKGVISYRYHEPTTSNRARGVVNFEYRVGLAGEAPQIIAETTSPYEPPATMATRLEKAKRDLQQLLGKVSKLVQ
jgi:hypothetical protein